MNAIKTLGTVAKFALIFVMIAATGYCAYELTQWNYYTAQFVRVAAGPLSSQEETVLALFILSAIIAPALGFLLLLSVFAQEWSSPSSPEGLRAKAEALMREAAALERYREQRRQERLVAATVFPRRGPR